MGGIGIIVNPRSRRNQNDPRAALRLARTLGDHGVVRAARNKDELCQIAEDFRKLKIDVLGISGGDGTNYVTITGFLEVYADEPLPPIAFLRGGTMNNVANAVGVPHGRPDGLLAALIKRYAARDGEPLRCVERSLMSMGSHYGFLFGTGALYGYLSEYNKASERNALWAARVLARASASVLVGGEFMRRVALRWEGQVTFDDGTSFPNRDYFGIAAGTVDQIGLGFRPFYRHDERPGHFHMLGIHTSAFGFVRRMPAIWQAQPMGEEYTFDKVVDNAIIEERGGVVHYICDGDLHEHKGPLPLRIGPAVKIIVELKPGLRPKDVLRRTPWLSGWNNIGSA
jgi:hypothetical protein